MSQFKCRRPACSNHSLSFIVLRKFGRVSNFKLYDPERHNITRTFFELDRVPFVKIPNMYGLERVVTPSEFYV